LETCFTQVDWGQALQWVLLMDPLWLPKSGRYLFIAILHDKPDYHAALHCFQSFLRLESSAQIGVSILDVNLVYHSLLGPGSRQQVSGHFSGMPV